LGLLLPSCPTQRRNPSAFSMLDWYWQRKAMNLDNISPKGK